ncbi:MAG: D-hexose-6-phosphate mutarotase [Phycisphaeraceae bacterium]
MSNHLPQGVQLQRDSHGLDVLVIDTPAASGRMYLHGAHVTAWRPAGHEPVLWMSGKSWYETGKPIRGGVPICFPWFGPKAGDASAPAHGFARLKNWTLADVTRNADGAITVTMTLYADDATRAMWPHDFAAMMRVTFGPTLQLELRIDNTGDQPIHFAEVLHTYFAVSDVRQVSVTGLAGAMYHDRLDPTGLKTRGDQPITITGETDRLYIHTESACVLNDPAGHRAITIRKTGSRSTVVWNPWVNKSKAMPDFGDDEWPGMICIETLNAGENAVTLPPAPGTAAQSHTMAATIEVKRL